MNAAFPYLDLAIGMCFVYLLMALICTTINESLAGILNSRGKTLAQGISELLRDPALKQLVYEHPLVQGVQQGANSRLPSYLSSDKFALALTDVLTGPAAVDDPAALRRGIQALTDPQTKKVLSAVLAGSTTLQEDQRRLAAWYDQGMNRISGWYKRTAQIRVFVLAALVTILLNADTLNMLKVLWYNPTLSALVLENAKARQQQGTPVADPASGNPGKASGGSDRSGGNFNPANHNPSGEQAGKLVITAQEEDALRQITGWNGDWYGDWKNAQKSSAGTGVSDWLGYLARQRLLGWLITILAVSLGAPFWFDTLSKFMNVRNSGPPPSTLAERLAAQKAA